MCWACEQEEMLAAYREYVAQRKAQRGEAAARSNDGTDAAPAEPAKPDWAQGAWFATAIKPKE